MNLSSPARNNNMAIHKSLYKSPAAANQNNLSPSWRDAYKRRCFDEFKKSRQKLLTRFRNFKIDDQQNSGQCKVNTFKDYLDEELEKICLLQASSCEFVNYDEAMEIYKQMQIELKTNPSQYEIDYDYEIDNYYSNNSNKVSIICPLCQKCELNYYDSQCDYICCSSCKFYVNCNKSNGCKLKLENLDFLLSGAVREHVCNETPNFQVVCDDDTFVRGVDTNSVLIMCCDKCNFMKVIL